eukprot:SAG31_NODE_1713_length_7466_cov_4.386182_5_plen_201_part_00
MQAFEGFRQGGPYSCVLAALALVTLLKQARAAINKASGVPDLPQSPSPDQRVEHWHAAAQAGSVGAYLDDAALTTHMRPLVMGAAAYMAEGSKKNWKFVSYKSILTADWYGPPLRPQRWQDCIENGEGGQPYANSVNCPPFSATQDMPTSAQLLPGVVITIAREGMTCRQDRPSTGERKLAPHILMLGRAPASGQEDSPK